MMLKNMTPATVLLIGAISLTAGWWAGTSTSPSQSPKDAPAGRKRAGARPAGAADDVAPFTGQLRKRLETQAPRTPSAGRNPFVFGTRQSSGVARRGQELPPAALVPLSLPMPERFAPPPPQIKLSGVAASQSDGATVLTAIVNDNGAMVFLKTGDKLSNGATVIRVDETAIVIIDVAGITQTIRLP